MKTKTDLIRAALRSRPRSDRSPTAIVKSLRAAGHSVTRGHVSVVKSTMEQRKTPSVRELVLAKRFLAKVGGASNARAIIGVLSKIIR